MYNRQYGKRWPRRVPELDFPFSISMDDHVVGDDLDLISRFLPDKARKNRTDKGGHSAEPGLVRS